MTVVVDVRRNERGSACTGVVAGGRLQGGGRGRRGASVTGSDVGGAKLCLAGDFYIREPRGRQSAGLTEY